eukprot:TRINITY_DN849_c0_g1_i2.p1 TRINITY_DN849_c0_g1~~TRINITY_DN849_c0_g1_i2.p1  ORF type:complete len:100 (+),score=0.37 TRINITY_DN849_c0_g1_i2:136-435(+)
MKSHKPKKTPTQLRTEKRLGEIRTLLKARPHLTVYAVCKIVAKHHYKCSAKSLHRLFSYHFYHPSTVDHRRKLTDNQEQLLAGIIHSFAMHHVSRMCFS